MKGVAKIPMLHSQLPNQKQIKAGSVPHRPENFWFDVSDSCAPEIEPAFDDECKYLCQAEWAWGPFHTRLDAYYLYRTRQEWVLMAEYWNDDDGGWIEACAGVAKLGALTMKQAAVYLLLERWRFEAENSDLDHYHWINEEGYLTIADIKGIARVVWPGSKRS